MPPVYLILNCTMSRDHVMTRSIIQNISSLLCMRIFHVPDSLLYVKEKELTMLKVQICYKLVIHKLCLRRPKRINLSPFPELTPDTFKILKKKFQRLLSIPHPQTQNKRLRSGEVMMWQFSKSELQQRQDDPDPTVLLLPPYTTVEKTAVKHDTSLQFS